MLNENALKMVGPSYEELQVNTEASITPKSELLTTVILSSAFTVTTMTTLGFGKK